MREVVILASIPGQCIGAALQALPDAATAQQKFWKRIDVPGRGQVRITCKRFFHKHGKWLEASYSSHWIWTVEKAVWAE